MRLRDLLWVLKKPTIIWVSEDDKTDMGVYLGEAGDCLCNIKESYLDATVMAVYTEYYNAYATTGISIIVNRYFG